VEVAGNRERLRAWLGDDELPIHVTDGEADIPRVAVGSSDREIVIG
jgi:hypothetical protein